MDEQAGDVLLVDIVGDKIAPAVELLVHARAVDHGDDVVEVEQRGSAFCILAKAGDGIGDGNGLANTRCLYDDVVELAR